MSVAVTVICFQHGPSKINLAGPLTPSVTLPDATVAALNGCLHKQGNPSL